LWKMGPGPQQEVSQAAHRIADGGARRNRGDQRGGAAGPGGGMPPHEPVSAPGSAGLRGAGPGLSALWQWSVGQSGDTRARAADALWTGGGAGGGAGAAAGVSRVWAAVPAGGGVSARGSREHRDRGPGPGLRAGWGVLGVCGGGWRAPRPMRGSGKRRDDPPGDHAGGSAGGSRASDGGGRAGDDDRRAGARRACRGAPSVPGGARRSRWPARRRHPRRRHPRRRHPRRGCCSGWMGAGCPAGSSGAGWKGRWEW
jgi:hypothetical protein